MASTISFQNSYSGMQIAINNGTINAQSNLYTDLLNRLPNVPDATFDSYMDQHENECLPGTRVELLGQIAEWALSPNGKPMFWLNGMAGTGKSTISRTIARLFKQKDLLGASFFFKRGGGDRQSAMKLFPTIIRQLISRLPQLMPGIQNAVQDDPDIASKSLREQFDKLLLQPLLALNYSGHQALTLVIVIDALDECERDDDMRMIIQLLSRLMRSNATGTQVRTFITSRPELPIRLGFSNLANHAYEDLILHQVPELVVRHDICLFLKHRLSTIRANRPLPTGWPEDDAMQSLVTLSVPLFIYAATVCRILEDPQWDPIDSLAEILAHRYDDFQLDGTYLPVLNRLLNGQSTRQTKQLIQEFRDIIGVIVILENPLSVSSLSKLLGISEGVIDRRVNSLQSVLSIPSEITKPVRLFHTSFRDFLLDPETRDRTPFWLDGKEIHQMLTRRCLNLCDSLKRNICSVKSAQKRARIRRQTIDRELSPELRYACRYWVIHLAQSKDPIADIDNVFSFLRKHFLHWMEAMSILGLASEIVGIISQLQSVLDVDRNAELSEFLHDIRRFVLKNRQIADEFPLQIYCSGLVFAPETSLLRKQFKGELPKRIRTLSNAQERWSTELQSLEGHAGSVNAVAFSPDGRLMASGSDDKTIRFWDATTGALQQTLEGHAGPVESLVFSPDGQLLVSASYHAIRLWDAATGALRQIRKGHSDRVKSLVFSPDGRLLTSISDESTLKHILGQSGPLQLVDIKSFGWWRAPETGDETIRLWGPTTNSLPEHARHNPKKDSNGWPRLPTLGSLTVAFSPDGSLLASVSSMYTDIYLGPNAHRWIPQAHLGLIKSLAFSPDSQMLASASVDETIRLWDTKTGALQRSFPGHSLPGKLMVFSPDGQLLATRSYHTVRLCDTVTSASRILRGHTRLVNSMVFSLDGRRLASASDDKSIRLWDTATGTIQQSFEGNSYPVKSLAFSPDGKLLASASDDKTVRLWDATNATLQPFGYDSGPVDSLVFSPNGQLLASASVHTVRVWDAATGALRQTLEGHSGAVKSLAFSPDSRLLASASDDMTVRLWEAATGTLKHALRGHSGPVDSVAFVDDGLLVTSISTSLWDDTVRLWGSATGRLVETSRGSLNSHSISNITMTDILLVEDQWVTLHGEKALWLPLDYRVHPLAVKGNILALGHASGRFSVIQFSPEPASTDRAVATNE